MAQLNRYRLFKASAKQTHRQSLSYRRHACPAYRDVLYIHTLLAKTLRQIREQLRTGKTRGTRGRTLELHELDNLRAKEAELVAKQELAKRDRAQMRLQRVQGVAQGIYSPRYSPSD